MPVEKNKGRHFACSDLHGCYNLYNAIQNFIQPEDIVYFLGDAIDRGPDSWKLFKAIINNTQWVYLCGNHEEMFADTIIEYKDLTGSEHYYDFISNGGLNTFNSWIEEGAYTDWVRIIHKLPLYKSYVNKDNYKIYLSHAGFTPRISQTGEIIIPNRKEILWNRNHFNESWDYENFSDTIIIHGHTPIPYLMYTNEEKIDNWNDIGAFYYCNEHKINIDTECCWTHGTVLLDLDSFDEYIFE